MLFTGYCILIDGLESMYLSPDFLSLIGDLLLLGERLASWLLPDLSLIYFCQEDPFIRGALDVREVKSRYIGQRR